MNDAIGHGGEQQHFGRTGERGLESWEVDVNMQQVPSALLHLLFTSC